MIVTPISSVDKQVILPKRRRPQPRTRLWEKEKDDADNRSNRIDNHGIRDAVVYM
jgi:hypothetical protein